MPIFPVTRIPVPVAPTFPEYIIQNHISDIFIPNGTQIQRIPMFSINQPLTILNSNDNLVRIIAPTNGIISNFRIFIVQNTTTKFFEIDIFHGGFQTFLLDGINADANTLYTSSVSIGVTKDDVLNYTVKAQASAPTVGKLESAYMSFTFKPTSPN